MYHVFICFSANGNLDGVHVLASVNSAAVNIGMHVFIFSNYGFLQIYA